MDAVDDRNDHRHPGDDDQRPGRTRCVSLIQFERGV